jgi:hypothetical protein
MTLRFLTDENFVSDILNGVIKRDSVALLGVVLAAFSL